MREFNLRGRAIQRAYEQCQPIRCETSIEEMPMAGSAHPDQVGLWPQLHLPQPETPLPLHARVARPISLSKARQYAGKRKMAALKE